MDLILGLIFSSVGTGYLVYAKRQHNGIFAIAGALLCLYSYFLSNPIAIFVIGVGITTAPFAIERYDIL
jgi:hypothetical protein